MRRNGLLPWDVSARAITPKNRSQSEFILGWFSLMRFHKEMNLYHWFATNTQRLTTFKWHCWYSRITTIERREECYFKIVLSRGSVLPEVWVPRKLLYLLAACSFIVVQQWFLWIFLHRRGIRNPNMNLDWEYGNSMWVWKTKYSFPLPRLLINFTTKCRGKVYEGKENTVKE